MPESDTSTTNRNESLQSTESSTTNQNGDMNLDQNQNENEINDEEEEGGEGEEILSDLPNIRRQHMTTGYREGLSIGKSQVIQSGFDEGYPLGIEMGLRIGKLLGLLEGYLSGLNSKDKNQEKEEVRKVYDRAKKELEIKFLLERFCLDENDTEIGDDEGELKRIWNLIKSWEDRIGL